jgi:hypothetical protein
MSIDTIPWLLGRFNEIRTHPPHYESSYYGPINMLLTTYFPARDGFIVKPQTRLRWGPGPQGRTSTDSYGQSVGISNEDINPDFLVSIGTPRADSDVPLLIVEVKREGEDFGEAALQIDRYCNWARRYQQNIAAWGGKADVAALLVMGSSCWVFEMVHNSFSHTRQPSGIISAPILSLLQDIHDMYCNS